MTSYEIHYSRPRANRGLKAWGIFEIVSPTFSRGIAAYHTHAKAEEALARLQETMDEEGQNAGKNIFEKVKDVFS